MATHSAWSREPKKSTVSFPPSPKLGSSVPLSEIARDREVGIQPVRGLSDDNDAADGVERHAAAEIVLRAEDGRHDSGAAELGVQFSRCGEARQRKAKARAGRRAACRERGPTHDDSAVRLNDHIGDDVAGTDRAHGGNRDAVVAE